MSFCESHAVCPHFYLTLEVIFSHYNCHILDSENKNHLFKTSFNSQTSPYSNNLSKKTHILSQSSQYNGFDFPRRTPFYILNPDRLPCKSIVLLLCMYVCNMHCILVHFPISYIRSCVLYLLKHMLKMGEDLFNVTIEQ